MVLQYILAELDLPHGGHQRRLLCTNAGQVITNIFHPRLLTAMCAAVIWSRVLERAILRFTDICRLSYIFL